MIGTISTRKLFLAAIAVGLLVSLPAIPQTSTPAPPRPRPRLEAVAETKLLMEGLAQSNFRGLEKHLRQRPVDEETWKFARGQALLLAETGNLLMLRPPRNPGETAWMDKAMDLRATAKRLAQAAGQRDYGASRKLLVAVANTCTTCHQSFRVPIRIAPFADPADEPGIKTE